MSECVCGEPATVSVMVEYVDEIVIYEYCPKCAEDVEFTIEGAKIL